MWQLWGVELLSVMLKNYFNARATHAIYCTFAFEFFNTMATIKFQFEDQKIESKIFTITKGESVLDIAMDENIGLHHNCGGVCGCSTCHIYIHQGMNSFQEISDREEDFIDRAINPKINSRLACQCVVENDLDMVVIIPDQTALNGH